MGILHSIDKVIGGFNAFPLHPLLKPGAFRWERRTMRFEGILYNMRQSQGTEQTHFIKIHFYSNSTLSISHATKLKILRLWSSHRKPTELIDIKAETDRSATWAAESFFSPSRAKHLLVGPCLKLESIRPMPWTPAKMCETCLKHWLNHGGCHWLKLWKLPLKQHIHVNSHRTLST